MHDAMLAALGPSRWWPGDTPFEVAVGAVLTQNTNWKNVEKAIANLRAAGALEARAMDALPAARLAELVRPSGSFNVKAARLKNLLALLRDEADYDIRALSGRGLDALRPLLLGVRGVGPETADSILLYALDEPTFVVDAYTRRILGRHALLPEDAHYDEVREFFMDALPRDAALFNEYHALLVRVAKDFCRKARPLCDGCPLEPFLER
jgi:endonuclease-3 related protein